VADGEEPVAVFHVTGLMGGFLAVIGEDEQLSVVSIEPIKMVCRQKRIAGSYPRPQEGEDITLGIGTVAGRAGITPSTQDLLKSYRTCRAALRIPTIVCLFLMHHATGVADRFVLQTRSGSRLVSRPPSPPYLRYLFIFLFDFSLFNVNPRGYESGILIALELVVGKGRLSQVFGEANFGEVLTACPAKSRRPYDAPALGARI
jgi:hypothetical protein